MGIIKLLSEHEAQKIAAGEVVERPANVVKELVENSIDAGAKSISISIEQAGKKMIKVVDDGCGMSPEDARLSFLHHATSKITTVDDLNTIHTFGFRGEALAAISAVARVTLISKDASTHQGTRLEIEKNNIVQESIVACPTGTDIAIRDLFYNLPVRKKFLRSDTTELNHINLLFQAFCFSFPAIHFKLFVDNKLLYNCPTTAQHAPRLTQLWESLAYEHMIELDSTPDDQHTHLHGIISNHQLSRFDRNHIFFFVNNRWVKNYQLTRALMQGYEHILPKGKFPLSCLFLTVPPSQVDINIHPRKEEVAFLHPRIVQQLITSTVHQQLQQRLNILIKQPAHQDFARTTREQSIFAQSFHQQAFATHDLQTPPRPLAHHAIPPINYQTTPEVFSDNLLPPDRGLPASILTFQSDSLSPTTPAELAHDQQSSAVINESLSDQSWGPHSEIGVKSWGLLGQYAQTYLLIETHEGLLLIDQHAAHERIIYDRLCTSSAEDIPSIALIAAQVITLSRSDIELITPYLDLFLKHGIVIEPMGPHELVITKTPVALKNAVSNDLIAQVISWIAQDTGTQESITQMLYHKFRAQIACKAAIKAGDELTTEQMHQLIRDLATTPNRLTCPHGRPTSWVLSRYDIERKFKRKI